ncbi:MAG: hypothetical protein AAGN35_26395 [Bacteroidota bacterium]
MKKFFLTPALILFALALVVTGCKQDEDQPTLPPAVANEPEVITTLTLSFTDANNVQPDVAATFRDPDGDGGGGPDVFDNIELVANTTYNVAVTLLNETESPAEDVTVEILEENAEHLFCFVADGGSNITVTRTDTDGTFEVGLQSQWVTGAASTGNIVVTLKHQPDGLKDGTCTPGETDIEVDFPLIIN